RGEADVDLRRFVFAGKVKDGPRFGHRAEPALAGDVRDVLLQLDDAFSSATFAAKQAGLVEWYAISDRPFAFGDMLVVPASHIEPFEFLIGAHFSRRRGRRVVLRHAENMLAVLEVIGAHVHGPQQPDRPCPRPSLAGHGDELPSPQPSIAARIPARLLALPSCRSCPAGRCRRRWTKRRRR